MTADAPVSLRRLLPLALQHITVVKAYHQWLSVSVNTVETAAATTMTAIETAATTTMTAMTGKSSASETIVFMVCTGGV